MEAASASSTGPQGWDRVIGQPRAVETLRRAVAGGRVAQAYLFHGPDGAGKRAAALALAQAVLCERRPEGAADPCGACPSCRKARRGLHPDVHVFMPFPKGDKSHDPPADFPERVQRTLAEPYAEVSYRRRASLDDPDRTPNKQALYNAEYVRSGLMPAMRYAPAEGRASWGLVLEADAMSAVNHVAANAFLKLLEEPPPRTFFVLTVDRTDRLLPTIVSRCQRVRFDALPAEEIEGALAARGGVDPAAAALLARMADGSFTRALTLAESEALAEDRQLVLDFLRAAYGGGEVAGLAERAARLGRERLRTFCDLLLRWVRDLVLVRTLGEAAPIVNVDQRESIVRFVGSLPHARLDAMERYVQEADALLQRNVNATLALIVLADALRDAMAGRERAALYRPLTEPVAAPR